MDSKQITKDIVQGLMDSFENLGMEVAIHVHPVSNTTAENCPFLFQVFLHKLLCKKIYNIALNDDNPLHIMEAVHEVVNRFFCDFNRDFMDSYIECFSSGAIFKGTFLTLLDYETNKEYLDGNNIIYEPLSDTGLVSVVVVTHPGFDDIKDFFFADRDLRRKLGYDDITVEKLLKSAKENTIRKCITLQAKNRLPFFFCYLNGIFIKGDVTTCMFLTDNNSFNSLFGAGSLFDFEEFQGLFRNYGPLYAFIDPMVGTTVVPKQYVKSEQAEPFLDNELNYSILYYDEKGFRRISRDIVDKSGNVIVKDCDKLNFTARYLTEIRKKIYEK